MTMNDEIQVVVATDAFGAFVGYRGVVRAKTAQGLNVALGCTCPGAHATEAAARACGESTKQTLTVHRERAA